MVIAFAASFILKAQIRQPLTVHYAGLGAYSKNFNDVFSATSNQASLANLTKAAFAIYGERRFMLNEMNAYSAIMAVPTSSGTLGFSTNYFGSSAFNESRMSLMYGRKLNEFLDAGVSFNYNRINISGYNAASAINFDMGTIFHLTEKLYAGLHMYNPTSSKIGKSGFEKLAYVYRFGMGYEVAENLFISSEIVKQEGQQIGIVAGIQYNLQQSVFIRTGIATLNNNSYASLGINVGFARIDLNAAYHPQLGFTPGILLLITFKQPAEK